MLAGARLWIVSIFLAGAAGFGCRVGDEGLGASTPVTPVRQDGGGRPGADASGGGASPVDAHADAAVAIDASPPPPQGTGDASAPDAAVADAAVAADAAPPADAGPADAPAPASRCSSPRPLPVTARRVIEGRPSDDIAFDRDGHLVGFDRQAVVRLLRSGAVEPLATDVIGNRGGTLSALPGGELIVGDFQRSRAVRLTTSGQVAPIAGDVPSPMKMVRGPGQALYVTGKGGTITRISETDNRVSTAATTSFDLGGLSFGSDYRVLYVGALTTDGIYALDVQADGSLSPPRLWRAGVDRAQALATDECGDVYAISEGDARIRRVRASGAEVVASVPQAFMWSLAFGSGRQGWSGTALYAQEPGGRVHELELGVAGQPPPP
jgi:hypothetical protein